MEQTFQTALKHVLLMEGGFTNDPADHGGATNWGITAATLAHWRGHSVTPADVKAIPREEAIAIYHSNYWNTARCSDLPAGVDLVVFDVSVNSGPSRGIKMLQTAVAATADGLFGPATMAAVRLVTPSDIVTGLANERRKFYAAIVARDPTQKKFINGWNNRVKLTTAAAMKVMEA